MNSPAITPQPLLIEYKIPCPELPSTSIFNQPVFPHRTHKYDCTPIQIKQLLEYWAYSGERLMDCCKQYGIQYNTIRELQDKYSEIDELYARAHERKADTYFLGAIEAAEDDSNDITTVTKVNTRTGEETTYDAGNMVAVRRCELKQKAYLVAAERLSARYRPKSETISRNLNFNVSAKSLDLMSASADDLS